MSGPRRRISRRAVLGGLAASTVVGVAGCSSSDDDGVEAPPLDGALGPTPTPIPTPTPDRVAEEPPVVPRPGVDQPRYGLPGLIANDASGVIYAIDDQANLVWFQQLPVDDGDGQWPRQVWHEKSGTTLAAGWRYRALASLGFGVLLGLDGDGDLYWHRDLDRQGGVNWSAKSGRRIGEGWGARHIVGLHSGHLLAIDPDGSVWWYQWLGDSWHPASGSVQVADDWFGDRACSGGGGVVYLLDAGEVRWHEVIVDRFVPPDAVPAVVLGERSGTALDGDFAGATQLLSMGAGVVIAGAPGGLVVSQHEPDLRFSETGSQRIALLPADLLVASDPIDIVAAGPPVDAYWVDQSVIAGDTAELAISTAAVGAAVTVDIAPVVGDSPMPAALDVVGVNQGKPPFAWRDGCGWRTTTVTIPPDAEPGLWSARLSVGDAMPLWVPLVVKPAMPRHRVALLVNTNTWNAYNATSGIGQYTNPFGERLSFHRPNRQLRPDGRLPAEGHDPDAHLFAGEVEVAEWLGDFDAYTDLDLHRGIVGFEKYAALVLSTHPEYWSTEMYDNVVAYLDGGGSVLYLGGNGLYERVSYEDDGTTMVLRRGQPEGDRDLMRVNGRRERELLGVAFDAATGDAALTYAPYRVVAGDHPLFEGTGLATGDLFVSGDGGRGGAGWEVDSSTADPAEQGAGSPPENVQLLAVGTLGEGAGQQGRWTPETNAHMTYYDHPGGGFVFSVGSIVFGHFMVSDERAQRVVRNAVNRALA